MLLAHLPRAAEDLAVWIMQGSVAVALVLLEVTHIRLAVWPHVNAWTTFFALFKPAEEQSSIWPLEETFAMHHVVEKWTLVDFAAACDSATPAVNFAVLKATFKDAVVREDLNSDAVWFLRFDADLATVCGAALAFFEF